MTTAHISTSRRHPLINQHRIVDRTASWISTVERNCRVAATKQIVLNLCNNVAELADAAAQAMTLSEASSSTSPPGELYRVYLDNFIEYLTPSLKQGMVVDGHVVDPFVVRRRHGTYTDVNMMRAVTSTTRRSCLAPSTASASVSASSGSND